MRLREAIDNISGLRFVVDMMPVLTAIGRRYLNNEEWSADRNQLEVKYGDMRRIAAIFRNQETADEVEDMLHLISQVLDIEATIESLNRGDILSDVELFQIKSFSLIVFRLKAIVDKWGIAALPELDDVVEILDPERKRVASFYIYDAYSQELAEIRQQLKNASGDEATELYQKQLEVEDKVRALIVDRLRIHYKLLVSALKEVVRLDIVQAKVRVAKQLRLAEPVITEGNTVYEGLFNPAVEAALRTEGREYQPVDIAFGNAPTLISGINMGGKTVCLKTLALAQTLCQFAMYVPAAHSEIVLVDCVLFSIDDGQNELSGLSSFAAEMQAVNKIIATINSGMRPLVLIDELARTTNPTEGRAIVGAMLKILENHHVRAFVSSHYDNIATSCRRLRVRGLRCELDSAIDFKHIDRYIDYSLVEEGSADVPHEALNIARLLGIDPQLIDLAESLL